MKSPVSFYGERETRAKILWNARKARGLRLLPRSASSGVGPNGRSRSACMTRLPDKSHLFAPCDNRIALKGE
jgi:hypothetical protein